MGQRLNIEIQRKNKTLANSYYHWSAYSSSARELAQQIVNYINNNPQNCDDVLYAIRILEHTGAGLTDNLLPSELKTAQEMFPNEKFKECKGRNYGLLAITDKGIEETRDWEEGRVTINLDNKTINFEVYWEYDPTEEDDYDTKPQFEKLALNLDNLKFTDLDELAEQINFAENSSRRIINELPNGNKIQFIF